MSGARNTAQFLDAVKARHRLRSDYQLAKLLNWSTSRISQYRTTTRELDDDGCVQVADKLGVSPLYVLASIAAERASSATVKRHWRAAAKKFNGQRPALVRRRYECTCAFHGSRESPTPPAHINCLRCGGVAVARGEAERVE